MKVFNVSTEFSMCDSNPDLYETTINALVTTREVEFLTSNMYKEARLVGYSGDVSASGKRADGRKTANDEVIFNPPATILYIDGRKYVSKAHNEEFDEEKGLLMCLAKANGITHLQLKRMLKGAKRNGKTSP